jgi:hypothetical protein
VAVLAIGCGVDDPSPRKGARRTTPAEEERQAIRRDIRLISLYCRHVPPTTAREAGAAVGALIKRLRRRAGADVWEQHDWRLHMAEVAGFLERRACLPRWVPRIDRALRRLPLAEPPPEAPEYDYEPEQPDYEPYGY